MGWLYNHRFYSSYQWAGKIADGKRICDYKGQWMRAGGHLRHARRISRMLQNKPVRKPQDALRAVFKKYLV